MALMEGLEVRRLLAAATWEIAFSDPGRRFESMYPTLTEFISRAGNEWAELIPGTGAVMRVSVNLATGTIGSGGRLSARSFGTTRVRDNVFDQTATARLRYGDAPTPGGDIELNIDGDYLAGSLWFDPAPAERATSAKPVPKNKVDAYSAILHELGHAFFWNGFRNELTGAPSADLSVFDTLVTVDGSGQAWFTGPGTVAFLGGPLPLTRGNLYHVGNKSGPGADLVADQLMNGEEFAFGKRYFMSDLDRAVVADLIVAGERPPPAPPPPPPPPVGREITFGGRTGALYTSSGGVSVLVSLRGPGSGVLRFAPGAPDNADPVAIELSGTTRTTTLTIGANAPVLLRDISFTAPLGTVSAPRVNLGGVVSFAGVGRMQFNELIGASVHVGTAVPVTQVTIAAGIDSSLTLPAVKSLSLGTWLNTDGADDEVAAESVGNLTVGTFGSKLSVAGSVSRARFAMLSNAGVSIGSRGTVTVTGDMVGSTLSAAQLAGTFSARTIVNSRIESVGVVGNLRTTGGVSGLTLLAVGGVGSMNFASLSSSTIAVGLPPGTTAPATFPTARPDFSSSEAQIRSLVIGRGGTFANNLLVAPRIGNLTLQAVNPSNSGGRFGLYADAIGTVRYSLPESPNGLFRGTGNAGVFSSGDFRIEVI